MNTFTKVLVGVAALFAGYAGYEYMKSTTSKSVTPKTSDVPPVGTVAAEDFGKGASQGAIDGVNDAKASLPKKARPSSSYSTDLVRQSNYEKGYSSTYSTSYDGYVFPDVRITPIPTVIPPIKFRSCEEILDLLPETSFRFVPVPAVSSEPSIRAWAKRILAENIPNNRIDASAFLSSEGTIGRGAAYYTTDQLKIFMDARECLIKDQSYTAPDLSTPAKDLTTVLASEIATPPGTKGVVGGYAALGVYGNPAVQRALSFQNKKASANDQATSFVQARNLQRSFGKQ